MPSSSSGTLVRILLPRSLRQSSYLMKINRHTISWKIGKCRAKVKHLRICLAPDKLVSGAARAYERLNSMAPRTVFTPDAMYEQSASMSRDNGRKATKEEIYLTGCG